MTRVLSSSSSSMCVGQVDPDHPLAVSPRDADITDTSLPLSTSPASFPPITFFLPMLFEEFDEIQIALSSTEWSAQFSILPPVDKM